MISQTETKTTSAREKKKNKQTASSYFSVWSDSIIEHHGKEHLQSGINSRLASLHRALRRKKLSEEDRQPFLEWSVENWHRVGQTQFSRYAKYPEAPSVEFFVAGIDKFYLAYCRKDQVVVRSPNNARAGEIEAKVIEQLREENKQLKLKISQLDDELRHLRQSKKRVGKKDTGNLPSWD